MSTKCQRMCSPFRRFAGFWRGMKKNSEQPPTNQPPARRYVHFLLTTLTATALQFGAAALIAFLAECAAQGKPVKTEYFFPPPPDEPRLQFLTSFASEKEFHGGEEKTFMNFLTGTKPPEKDLSKP